MKTSFTKITLAFILLIALSASSQITENFDGSIFNFTTTNQFYKNTTVDNWKALANSATFNYHWDTAFGGKWSSGAAYTNMKDTTNGTNTNLYACAAYNAFNGNNYVTMQNKAMITFSNSTTSLSGFFITNTTYAFKTMKFGNFASRKFGDTLGTLSGGLIPQGNYPDWFKLTVRGYQYGVLKPDSITFYLADYRFAGTVNDYIVKNWQYVNCTSLDVVDSVKLYLSSSDNGFFGMNTPGFFSIDNISIVNTVGLNEIKNIFNLSLFPNPTSNVASINYVSQAITNLSIKVYDMAGKVIVTQNHLTNLGNDFIELNTSSYEAGLYIIEVRDAMTSKRLKLIKL